MAVILVVQVLLVIVVNYQILLEFNLKVVDVLIDITIIMNLNVKVIR